MPRALSGTRPKLDIHQIVKIESLVTDAPLSFDNQEIIIMNHYLKTIFRSRKPAAAGRVDR